MKKSLPKGYRVYIPLVIVFVLLVLCMPRSTKFGYSYTKGSPWMYETLVAEFDFPLLKTQAELAEEKSSAESSIVPYYKMDAKAGAKAVQALGSVDFEGRSSMKAAVASSLGAIYSKGVADDDEYFHDIDETGYDKTTVYIQKDKRAVKKPSEEIYSVNSARLELLSSLASYPAADSLCNALGLYNLVVPNLELDEQMSTLVHNENTPVISPTKGVIPAGQTLVSRGEIVTAEIAQILDSYRTEYEESLGYSGNRAVLWCGIILLGLALVVVLFFTIYFTSSGIFALPNKYIYLLFIYTLASVTSASVSGEMVAAIYMVPFPVFLYYLLAFFRKKLILPVYMVSLLPLVLFSPSGPEVFVMQLAAGVVTIFLFDRFNRGWLQFVNALIVYAVLALTWFAFRFIGGLDSSVDYVSLLWLFIGSMLSVALYPLIYLFEKIFNLVSSSRLIELADTNNKALRELAVKAPGTFQHSLQVANFAECAARSIGADVPLVRAGALYHDIGKTLNPQCFVENEALGETYHQSLDPAESAREIIRHVSDGVQLAEKYHLPSVVREFITTHHGTTKTGFFYSKYINAGGDPSDVADFTYPGPCPTTKEQVIVMLCDSLEAASRTLKDRTPKGISDFVEKIITAKYAEGQFVDADISIKELHEMSESLKDYIQQVYHGRVAYPDAKKKNKPSPDRK